MIIGNNNSFNNDNVNFNNKFRAIKENSMNNKQNNVSFLDDTHKYTNINSKNDVADKSFQILKDRLDKGLISFDEFNKRCQSINKTRQK